MNEQAFGPVITALIAPFDAQGRLDLKLAKRLARRSYEQGASSVLVNGTTGESPVLSAEEKYQLVEAVVEEIAGDCPVIANVGSNSTQVSVDAARQAQSLGVDALMAVVPYYNKPPQSGMYAHFAAIAQASNLPLICYNIPGRCGVNMQASTTLALAHDFDNIVAVKEAAGDLDQLATIVEGAPEGFAVYSGDDALTLEAMKRGAVGVISTTSNVSAQLMRAITDPALQGDFASAELAHNRALALMDGLFATTNPILVKKSLELLGYPVGGLRLPLVGATEEETAALEGILAQYKGMLS